MRANNVTTVWRGLRPEEFDLPYPFDSTIVVVHNLFVKVKPGFQFDVLDSECTS